MHKLKFMKLLFMRFQLLFTPVPLLAVRTNLRVALVLFIHVLLQRVGVLVAGATDVTLCGDEASVHSVDVSVHVAGVFGVVATL